MAQGTIRSVAGLLTTLGFVGWVSSCQQMSKSGGVLPPRATETQYTGGRTLQGRTFRCKSDEVAAAGFWRDVSSNKVKLSASVQKQSSTTTWRIALKGKTADVAAFSGSTQTLEPPEIFTVEETTGGLLLISRDRVAGESPQIITIDPSNSSFVYSSQHVNPVLNRANVFHGSCVASP